MRLLTSGKSRGEKRGGVPVLPAKVYPCDPTSFHKALPTDILTQLATRTLVHTFLRNI